MSVVKFIKDESTQNCEITQISEHVLKIVLSQKIDEDIVFGGFEVLNEHNFELMGVFHDYKTEYEESNEELTYILSDNGSVKPDPEPEPEPYIPTLEEVISNKVYELDASCQYAIINGVDVEIGDDTEHFSYTIEDQANIDDIAQMAKSTSMEQSYHCDGGSCKLYSVEEITKIYMTQKMNKAHNITYNNQLKLYAKSLTEKSDVEAVTYGQGLTGEYLETYNTIMEHEKKVAEAFIGA